MEQPETISKHKSACFQSGPFEFIHMNRYFDSGYIYELMKPIFKWDGYSNCLQDGTFRYFIF